MGSEPRSVPPRASATNVPIGSFKRQDSEEIDF